MCFSTYRVAVRAATHYIRAWANVESQEKVLLCTKKNFLQPSSMVKKTGYEVGHFVDCLKELHTTYVKAESHPQQAVMEKYKVDK